MSSGKIVSYTWTEGSSSPTETVTVDVPTTVTDSTATLTTLAALSPAADGSCYIVEADYSLWTRKASSTSTPDGLYVVASTLGGNWHKLDRAVDNLTTTPISTVAVMSNDFAEKTESVLNPIFPWSAPVLMSTPSFLPFFPTRCEWSPNGEYLAVSAIVGPEFLTIYQRIGNKLVSIAVTQPVEAGYCVAWSPDGKYLAVGHDFSPFISIFSRVGSVFTKIADPATLPADKVLHAEYSRNGEFLACVVEATPAVVIYRITNGTTYTKLSDPANLPTAGSYAVSWSPDGKFLAIGDAFNSPYFRIYERTAGTTFTKLSNPASLPNSEVRGLSFSPDGKYLAVAHEGTGYLHVYSISGNTFTKIADPATLPTNNALDVAWSPDGAYLAVATEQASNRLVIYSMVSGVLTQLTPPATSPTDSIRSVSWSSDGQYIASISLFAASGVFVHQTASDMAATGNLIMTGLKRAGSI